MKSAAPTSTPAAPRKPRTGVARYNPKLALLLCERIASRPLSLLKVCEAPDMPGIATIFRWLREHPEFQEMDVLARETQAEVLLEEALDLVDNDANDIIHTPDGKIVFNRLALQRCKMQVEHRRWIAAKLLPRKYGTHPRERSAAEPPSPAPATPPVRFDGPPPGGIITEEYRMQLIADRRKIMDEGIAAVAAANAQNSPTAAPPSTPAGSPVAHSDLRSPATPELRPPNRDLQPRPPSSEYRPSPPPPQGSPTGHNPKPWYDVPTPRRPLSTMNKACS